MNSKNFLFAAVFVILSFFAICFVWEARPALPIKNVSEAKVGSCDEASGIRQNESCVRKEMRFSQRVTDVVVNGQIFHLCTGCELIGSVTVCSGETGIVPEPGEGTYYLTSEPCTGYYVPRSYSEIESERLIDGVIYIEVECRYTPGDWTNCGSKQSVGSC